MRKRTSRVELINGRLWAYVSLCKEPATAPLHELLHWILEQLNLGNSDFTVDDEGRLASLVVGAGAAPLSETATFETVASYVQSRMLAVNLAGLLAQAREEGIEPQHATLAKRAQESATPAAHDNTQMHYAIELLKILARIRGVSFVFTSPPIKTKAGPSVVALLREATRAYLFNLRRSCVSLCRALLEASLREKVPEAVVLEERFKTKKGELECLINLAAQRRLLSTGLCAQSHRVRQAGNRALHGREPSDDDAWRVLQDTRVIVSTLYS